MAKTTKKRLFAQLGVSPQEIGRDLAAFSDAARVLSADHPRLIEQHPRQWVGVFKGKVAASAKSMAALMTQLQEAGIPVEKTIVRYIDKDERTLIL